MYIYRVSRKSRSIVQKKNEDPKPRKGVDMNIGPEMRCR